jgi:predicted HD superfamily hydrolase involved in NAD metabolism
MISRKKTKKRLESPNTFESEILLVMIHLEDRHIRPVWIISKLDFIIKYLEDVLDRDRVLHSIGTYHTMLQLSRILEEDSEIAAIGGLVHDCARGWSYKRIKEILEDSGHPLSQEDIPFPKIWHAQLGAFMLKATFGIDHEGLASAIRFHPTGAPGMDRLAKLLFIADYIEPTRSFKGVDSIRKIVYTDWEAAFRIILKEKINHVRDRGTPLHPRALKALQSYIKEDE